jgi:hypothetical protein
MSGDIKINKGVELMLRRELKKDQKESKPETSGLKLRYTFTLLKRKFNLVFEFTWEGN